MLDKSFGILFEKAKQQVALPSSRVTGARPFQCLGHDRGKFFFYTSEGRQVLALSSRDLSSTGELLQLASLRWLEGAYPGRESFNTRDAASALIRECYAVGVFDPDARRGRGVWLDDGRLVMHLGDHLLVDGKATQLTDHRSRYIYEQAQPLNITLGEPLTDAESRSFLALCRSLSWSDPIRDGSLFAGWIVSALIGGVLAWRPHLWLTGEAGGGKTWIMDNILIPAFGSFALLVQGKTSEAGIRGELGQDARPVLFDEAETQSEQDRGRIQQVIDLARQASSEHGAAIVKGTQDGGSRRQLLRASFLFASINVGLTQAADESRFAVLTLVEGNPDQFAALKIAHAEAMVPNFCGRLLARLLAMAPIIRANAETLADAIARTGAGRRAGDTLGTLIAGQLALVNARQITPEEAAKIVEGREWVKTAAAEARAAPEWERALAHLMQAEAMRRTTAGRTELFSVSELLGAITVETEGIGHLEAKEHLRRMSMRVMDERLLVGNRSTEVAQLFRSTPWGSSWSTTLARMPGAKRGVEVRFDSYRKDKALSLPLAVLRGEGI
ncbi:hypothetical protein [Falsiroseomonas sp. E2-1-a20]|uniref:hypothetical protein n=1 Tax=Falsiroseomonas sp. E2-1-a20 TaxID=3239300 RepID=UPI003F347EE0